jgi:ribonuclease HI
MQNNFTIYADGSSLGNPGAGGWGVLILQKSLDGKVVGKTELGGGEKYTTNNKMELQALIEVLKFLQQTTPSNSTEFTTPSKEGESMQNLKVELRLDSQYVINGATVWCKNWIKNNWIKSDKKPVLNKEYWIEIISLLKNMEGKVQIKWTHVYGHTGEEGNERVDVIAKSWAKKFL